MYSTVPYPSDYTWSSDHTLFIQSSNERYNPVPALFFLSPCRPVPAGNRSSSRKWDKLLDLGILDLGRVPGMYAGVLCRTYHFHTAIREYGSAGRLELL